jgi:hypothetical protein
MTVLLSPGVIARDRARASELKRALVVRGWSDDWRAP